MRSASPQAPQIVAAPSAGPDRAAPRAAGNEAPAQLAAGSPVLSRAAVLRLQRTIGNAAVMHLLASSRPPPPAGTVQAAPSELADFTVAFEGSAADLPAQIAANETVQALLQEQFPGRAAAAVLNVFGFGALREEEVRRGEALNDTRAQVVKFGNALNVEIRHTYFALLYNILSFGQDPPTLKLYKWDRGNAQPSPGLGLRLFDHVRAAAVGMEIPYIEADAIGDPVEGAPENGYYTWPRFGFDAPIGDMNKFIQRIAALQGSRAGMAQREADLAAAVQALPAEARPAADAQQNRHRMLELRNRRVMNDGLEPADEAELAALEMNDEVTRTRDAIQRHAAALDWIFGVDGQGAHADDLETVTDLFMLPGTAAQKRQLADLWKDYGQAVHGAIFDLAPDSKSNQVLAAYKA